MNGHDSQKSNIKAIFQALLVTLLWSSSFVIIKIGLDEIPPLVFAGLRYVIAFCFLLPLILKRYSRDNLKVIDKKLWIKLIFLGLIFYTFTQGSQFIGLSLLPSVTVSLLLNFTPIVVAIMGVFWLNEIPSLRGWIGIFIFIAGVLIYFFPATFEGNLALGILVMTIGVLANSGAAVLGRDINRARIIDPLLVTGISMGIGSIFLLIPGLIIHGFPSMSMTNFLLLLWMAIINTAFAFTLWNVTLKSLSAMESSIINGTMLIQIAILAWIFLGEAITLKEGFGMLIAAVGAVLVQIRGKK